MLDEAGGWKAADTALWREHLHAATAVGRMAAARRAVELGYAVEADAGVSGRWRRRSCSPSGQRRSTTPSPNRAGIPTGLGGSPPGLAVRGRGTRPSPT